jgi:hypothetical protein
MRAEALERLRQTMRGGATPNMLGNVGTLELTHVQCAVLTNCNMEFQRGAEKKANEAKDVPTVPAVPTQKLLSKKDAVENDFLASEPMSERVSNGRPLNDLDRLRAEAQRRNCAATVAELTDRWCSCGKLATVAVGRFKESPGNREGVARWLCTECFPLGNVTQQSEP